MKNLFLGLMLIAGSAQAEISLVCVTEFPSTSILLQEKGEVVDVMIWHHNGPLYAPIHMGPITPDDVAGLQTSANLIMKLGDRYDFTIPKSKCEQEGDQVISCTGGSDFYPNGMKAKPGYVQVSKVLKTVFRYKYEETHITFNFEVDSKTVQISSVYQAGECSRMTRSQQEELLRTGSL